MTLSKNPMHDNPLRDLMQMDHVVAVMPDGRAIDHDERFRPLDVHAPEVNLDYEGAFDMASVERHNTADMVASLRRDGWEVLSGLSAQYLTQADDPIMHESEYIGGYVEERIREEPGYWVRLPVEIHPGEDDPEHEDNGGNGESSYVGWIVARKIGSEDEIAARTQWIAEDLAPWHVDPAVKPPHLGYDADFRAQMSSPSEIHRGDSERDAINALINHLIRISCMEHVKRAGESGLYESAATDIGAGVRSVQPGGRRILRVRALLMPKEESK